MQQYQRQWKRTLRNKMRRRFTAKNGEVKCQRRRSFSQDFVDIFFLVCMLSVFLLARVVPGPESFSIGYCVPSLFLSLANAERKIQVLQPRIQENFLSRVPSSMNILTPNHIKLFYPRNPFQFFILLFGECNVNKNLVLE